jgi:hypothetical protein
MADTGELGSQRGEEQRNKAIKARALQADDAFRWIMNDERGRKVVWSLLDRAGVFRSSMAATPELTAFNEGRRDMGLALLADIMRLAPELYTRMAAEAAVKPRSNDKDNEHG